MTVAKHPGDQRKNAIAGSLDDEAVARFATNIAEVEADEGKLQYLRKKKRQAVCSKMIRWTSAFVAVTCTTAFATLLLAMFLCERFNMAVSCREQLQPDRRLPALSITVGCISFVFWAIDICWAGIVRRRLLALADKEANDLKKKQQIYADLGIKQAGDDDEAEAENNLSSLGARLKAQREGAEAGADAKANSKMKRRPSSKNKKASAGSASKKKLERERDRQQKLEVLSQKTGLDAKQLQKFKHKLTAKDLARMQSSPPSAR